MFLGGKFCDDGIHLHFAEILIVIVKFNVKSTSINLHYQTINKFKSAMDMGGFMEVCVVT